MPALLLLGWFVVPVVLLWLGQHLRGATARRRALFWGGVIGYCLGMIASLVALHAPPVLWTEGVRVWLAFGGALLGWGVGSIFGMLTQRR